MLQSAFIFSDTVPKCYIHMTVIRRAKIGVNRSYQSQAANTYPRSRVLNFEHRLLDVGNQQQAIFTDGNEFMPIHDALPFNRTVERTHPRKWKAFYRSTQRSTERPQVFTRQKDSGCRMSRCSGLTACLGVPIEVLCCPHPFMEFTRSKGLLHFRFRGVTDDFHQSPYR
jgi:hypothetical protein